MSGTDNSEMPMIEGAHFGELQPFRDGDDKGVGAPEWEVRVALDQFSGPSQILTGRCLYSVSLFSQ